MPVNGLAIKLIGFDNLESDYFTAILDLAEALLHQEWQVVTTETPDFFVFSEEGLKSNVSPDVPPARCFFYGAENTSDKHIAVNNRVPSLHSLVDVLNRAGANFRPAEDEDTLFKPSQGLLKALLNRDNNPVWLAVAGVDIWLDPAHGLYYCLVALEGLVPCCGADKTVETHVMTALELQQLVAKQNIPPKPLNNLIWYLVFKTSQGRLL
ncbi:MAG: hypothetical protein PHU14_12170 [Methylovulum sp.]|nr:hypothetical protein [Methylovulum sp.]